MSRLKTPALLILICLACLTAGQAAPTSGFQRYYHPAPDNVALRMPATSFPLDLKKIVNLTLFERWFLKPGDVKLLRRNGFVVVGNGYDDRVTGLYRELKALHLPFYVTADTVLHLFHVQFDESLKEIEEHTFYPDVVQVTRAMLEASEADEQSFSGDLKEAARRNVAYFSVAIELLEPSFKPPSEVAGQVSWEVRHIMRHQGFVGFAEARRHALFRVPEDYSQYKPRGHYTRSPKLKRYFRAMMWYGRTTFLLKGRKNFGPYAPPAQALTDPRTARLQTLEALLIERHYEHLKLADGRPLRAVWHRVYTVTAFYAGFSDDLTLRDYHIAAQKIFGRHSRPRDWTDSVRLLRFAAEVARMRTPAIFSGMGNEGIDPGRPAASRNTSIRALEHIQSFTEGLRLMGQRYIPDSYILSQLVSPGVGLIPHRIKQRFTSGTVQDERYPGGVYTIRAFPRGLDVFSVLGSRRAAQLLASTGDDAYPRYAAQLHKLRRQFAALTPRQWNQNLYWSWLYCLKSLVAPRGHGYQSYQQTRAWQDRQLNTALASWAALRHDTILMAKQSYTPHFESVNAMLPSTRTAPPPPVGLVEPLPTFFTRLLNTARMARTGLSDLKVADPAAIDRLTTLVNILEHLRGACLREADNKPLRESDDRFLASRPGALESMLGDIDTRGLTTTLVSDVHTDANSHQVLEEGSGYVNVLVVAYKRPSGDLVLAAGPVFSYYEFKQPMADRLTDRAWEKMLGTRDCPERPTWNASFTRLR